MGKSVLGLEYASKNILVAAIHMDSAFHVIDRSQKLVIGKMQNPNNNQLFNSI